MQFFFRKLVLLATIVITTSQASGQELFVFTEPASNMPAKSLGIRISNWIMDDQRNGAVNYHLIPELMWGVNKKLMIHIEGFASNRSKSLSVEGSALYVKYRFFSKDQVYRHFRMAAFERVAVNNSNIHQDEIETNGHNSGFETGIIATQLLHKQAISATISYEQAINNTGGNEFSPWQTNKALNYALSTGRLILPKDYTDYGQVNLNIMLECLGQYLPENNKSYLDAAVSLQLIFNSQIRVDIGYKRELYSNMLRTAPNGIMIRVEHLFFNAFN